MVASVLPAERMPGDPLQRTTGRVHRPGNAVQRTYRLGSDSAFLQGQAVRTNPAGLSRRETDAFLGDIRPRRHVFFEIRDCSFSDQAPANWEGRTVRRADVNIVVQIPYRCLASGWIVKQVIRTPVTVKVSRSHQRPPTGNGRPISASDQRSP